MAGESALKRDLRMEPPSDEDSVEAILTRLEQRLYLIRSEHAEVARALEEIVRDIRAIMKQR